MKHQQVYHKIVPEPVKPTHLSSDIKWLSGEGCGSWFDFETYQDKYLITRYSPEGKIECKGFFAQFQNEKFDIKEHFEMSYLSHCSEVKVIQNNIVLKFVLIQRIK